VLLKVNYDVSGGDNEAENRNYSEGRFDMTVYLLGDSKEEHKFPKALQMAPPIESI
jgi:hypothetical protein